MLKRLRRKFILTAMLSISLVLVLLISTVNILNALNTRQDIRNMLEIVSVDRQEEPPRKPDDKQRPGRDKPMEKDFAARYFILQYQSDGTLLDVDLNSVATVTQEDIPTYLDAALKNGPGHGQVGYYHFRVTSQPDGTCQAVFLYCYHEIDSVRTYVLFSLLALVCCEVITFLLVFFLSKSVVRPVVESMEKQKRFITDASHELKTPLTVITTCLSVLEMDVGQQKWIDKAQAQVGKLRDMVGKLVALSHLDEESAEHTMGDFDLSSAVLETAEPFSVPAELAGFELELDIAPNLRCHGDRDAICKLVSILLDNAVKYAQGDGAIRVTLSGKTLTVSNPCEEMSKAELSRLFDRFYRADAARAGKVGGSGIGLSIAESIVHLHRGSIRALCPTPNQIEFIVKF